MFRFTIRDLVLLTLVVALGVGWWMDRSRLASRAERATVLEAVVESAGWEVTHQSRGGRISQIHISHK
jgi:hypothetical protein